MQIRKINGKIIDWTDNLHTAERIVNMNYKEYVEYLQKKYLPVNGSYFSNSDFKSKNKRIRKLKYGLFIHHIQSYKFEKLSHWLYAKYLPFEYQREHNLVYCNLLEHALLHFKIWIETKRSGALLAYERLFREVIDIYENDYSHWDSRSLTVKERVFEMENIFWYFLKEKARLIHRWYN